MTLTQLRYIAAIAACGSFRRAAHSLGVSQPTVSEAVRGLERELDMLLFLRQGASVQLTEAGRHVLSFARRVAAEEETLRGELAALRDQAPRKLCLAICLGEPLPLETVRRFHIAHPGLEVGIDQCNALHVLEALQNGECDLGITYTELLTGRESSLPYGGMTFELFVPPDHPFAAMEAVAPEMLWEEAVQDAPQGGDHRHLNGVFKPCIDPMMEMIEARQRGRAAILPRGWASASTKMLCRRTDPPLVAPLSLVWDSRHFLSREAEELRALLWKSREQTQPGCRGN